MKDLWFVVLIFMLTVFTVSCDKSSDPKTDIDGTGVTDTENSDDTVDQENPEADEEEKEDDAATDNENNDSVTDDNEKNDDTPECVNDKMQCEDTVLEWCKDGVWTTVKDCADEEKACEVVAETPQCVEKEVKCTPDDLKCSGTKILKCNAESAWAEDKDCATDSQICEEDGDSVTCVDIVVAVCDENETKCSGDVVLKCTASGQWENDVVCSDSDKICVFESDAATCKFPPCTPDDTKCAGTEIQKCSSLGIWEVQTDCNKDNSKICKDNGTTVECIVPPVCTPGYTGCNANTVELCNAEGQWNSFTNCESSGKICVVNGSSATCQIPPCTPDDKKCSGKALLTCNSGGTWDSVDCPGIQICNDDGTTVECADPPECVENDKKCFGNTLMTCSAAGEWANAVNCESTEEFCDETGVAMCKCTPAGQKCEGTELKLCNESGVWGVQIDCNDTGKICKDNGITVECKIPAVCDPGQTQCNENTIETCNIDGQWVLSSTCSGTTPACLVIGEIPTCVCEDNDLRCQGVNLQKCSTGTWNTETVCSDLSKECRVIDETAQCATPLCTPDTKNCSGNTLLQCNSEGAWLTADVCSDHNELCRIKDTEYQCVCTPDALKCGERTENNHEDYILYKCNGTYDWAEQTDCLEADPENPKACTQTSTSASCTNVVCGDNSWHDMVEWCDSTDPVWAAINSGSQNVACNEYWTPESGIGGTGNIKCKSDCRVNLVNCTPTGTPYGTITTVDGNITFTLDSTRLSEETYNPAGAFIFDPVFTGNIDGGSIPLDAITSGYDSTPHSYAVHVDSSNIVVLIQLSLEYDPADPDNTIQSMDQDVYLLFDDTIQTGTHSVDIYSGLEIDVYGVDPAIAGTDKTCLKAFGFLGHVTFSSINNLTNADGGAFDVSGGPVYLFHPTDVPLYGDLTSQLSIPVCPM